MTYRSQAELQRLRSDLAERTLRGDKGEAIAADLGISKGYAHQLAKKLDITRMAVTAEERAMILQRRRTATEHAMHLPRTAA